MPVGTGAALSTHCYQPIPVLRHREQNRAVREPTVRTQRPRLVARTAELRELDRALTRSAAGGFGCIVLVGDAGAGKSRLAAEFTARLTGTTVLAARAYHLGAAASFGVWAEALDRELRTRTPEQVRRLCGATVADLAGLLHGVAALTAAPPVEPPRTRLLAALASVLRALAGERPVVVVVDDLHLADASSLEALHYLAHHCADVPLLVIGTARAVELADHPVAIDVVLRMEQDDLAHRLAVGPLDADGLHDLAADLLGRPPPGALVAWLAERTLGNPLDATGLLYALLDEDADLDRPVLRRLPEALAARVALRLRDVDPMAIEVVELLAVIGRRAELRGLVALSGRSPADLVDALDGLVHARLVTEDESGSEATVEITHPLVADAVYERMSAVRRMQRHREAGRVLQSMGRLGEAAGHFARSARPGDDEAVAMLRDAARAAEQAGAFQESLAVLGALVPLLPEGDRRWLDVVDALSWEATWAVDHRADSHFALGVPALRAMDRALAGLDDPSRHAPVKLRLAVFLAWGDGTLAEAQEVCRSAAALFERAGDRRGALLAAHELAFFHMLAGDLAVCEDAARAVDDAARRCGDAVVRSRAVRTVSVMALLRGRFADAQAAMAAGAGLAGGDGYREQMAVSGRAMAALASGRAAEGWALLDTVRTADPTLLADYDTMFSWHAGNITRAWASSRWAAGIGPTPATRRLGIGLFGAGRAAIEIGRLGDARRYAAQLRGLYTGWAMFTTFADHVDAMVSWREGRSDEALDLLRPAAAVQIRSNFVVYAVTLLLDLAEITGRAGAADPGTVAELTRLADRMDIDGYRGMAALAGAWSSLGGGDRAAARTLADRAAALTGDWPFHRARALHLLGEVTDDRDRAVAALTEAVAEFEGCGATLRRAEALDDLAALGSRGRLAAAAALGPSSLTGREREVAALAATGLSAREIGAALFIGARTVEGHLARAYARLGVRSKVELARRAVEFGLDTGTGTRTATPDQARPGP